MYALTIAVLRAVPSCLEAPTVGALTKKLLFLEVPLSRLLIILKTAVGSRKYAQVIDAPSKCQKRLITIR
ncbi:MAG: hypothetical protein ACI9D5_002646 [Candidatus Endobugula sp.]|jgi:hypothetical protein